MVSELFGNVIKELLHFWWFFVIAIGLKILIRIAKSPSGKGARGEKIAPLAIFQSLASLKGASGERIVSRRLRDGLPEEYKILNDIYLPLLDETTTQIDHIVVSQYGIFVVETKAYSGWIFGDGKSPCWTQTIYNKKSKFQNPIRQNYRHICALAETLGIDKSYFISVVVFTDDCEFKGEMPKGVIYSQGAVDYIRQFTAPLILVRQLDEIVSAIEEWQASISEERKAKHVENLKKRHNI
mgnify:CR=1 FL=1|jgi:hypothetical protein